MENSCSLGLSFNLVYMHVPYCQFSFYPPRFFSWKFLSDCAISRSLHTFTFFLIDTKNHRRSYSSLCVTLVVRLVALTLSLMTQVQLHTCKYIFTESSHAEHLFKRDNITVGSETKNIPRIKPGTNAYAECYVSVVVYNSTTNTNGLPGALVTVVSRTKDSNTKYNFTGYSQAVTNADGHACLPVYCRAEGIISVANKRERLFAQPIDVQKSKLPPHFRVAIQSNGEEIQFYSYVFGTIRGKTGPTYTTVEKSLCTKGDTTNYHFVFSYLSIPDELVSTPVPTKSPSVLPDAKTWYYGIRGTDIYTCYLKLIIRVSKPLLC